jgi:phosphoribosylformylglycinamidine synthase subunit PurL
VIGEVTGDGYLRFYLHGVLEAELPAEELVLGGGAPQYDRNYYEPAYMARINAFDPDLIAIPVDMKKIARQLITNPNIASKKWVAEQYDSTVGTVNCSTNAPSDAAIVRVKGSEKVLAITTDCNSRYVFANPYTGAQIAVAEAARNIVCSGGQPIGVTNCLNFGNPYDPEVYYQFVHAVKGMGEACRRLDTPVTGGNVSFYNQSHDGAVYPTPTIGMVGIINSLDERMTLDFKDPGDLILLIGKSTADINSSEYLHKIHAVEFSPAPYFDLEEEILLQEKIKRLIHSKIIHSAHDVSEGGLLVSLLESAFPNLLGFSVNAYRQSIRKDAYWFGESQSRAIVSISPSSFHEFKKIMDDHPFEELGMVTDGAISVEGQDWGTSLSWKELYDHCLERLLDAVAIL